jgi:hypothetical protein
VSVAFPEANVAVPITVEPSRNETVPAGVAPDEVTVAFKVNVCPATMELAETFSVVVVVVGCATAAITNNVAEYAG